MIVDMPHAVRFSRLRLFSFFVLFTDHIHLTVHHSACFPTTSTVTYTQTSLKAKPSRRCLGESRELRWLLFRRDSPASASTTALVPIPDPPRLHLHNPGLENAAYSIGTLQGHIVLHNPQQTANSNTIAIIPPMPPSPTPVNSIPTSAATAPSITDTTRSPPPLPSTNASGCPSPSLRTAHSFTTSLTLTAYGNTGPLSSFAQ
jgi:hypothetical protein